MLYLSQYKRYEAYVKHHMSRLLMSPDHVIPLKPFLILPG